MTSATRQRPSPSTPSHRTSRSYVHVGMDRSGAKTKRHINTVGIHGQPRRTAQVKKRGDNKWLISVYLGTDAAGKKLYSAKMVEGTRTEAEKQLRAFLSERDAGAVVAPSALTLDQHLDRWLDLVKIKIAERTAEDYKKWLAIYIRPELGSKRLVPQDRGYSGCIFEYAETEAGVENRPLRPYDPLSSVKTGCEVGVISLQPRD